MINGTRAYVTAVNQDAGTLTIRADEDRRVAVLPREYLDAGHVAHGYAITGHKGQGMTTGQALVLGSDAIYREWGYVALSRGRDKNHLYVVAAEDGHDEDELHGHGQHEPGSDQLAALSRALEHTRAAPSDRSAP